MTQKKYTAHSPGYYARKRLMRNRLAVGAMIVIILAVMVAILGYAIMPDHTPAANDQIVEYSIKPLGFTGEIVKIKKEYPSEEVGFFKMMLVGKENDFVSKPIISYEERNDSIITNEVSGEVNEFPKSRFLGVTEKKYFLGTDYYGRDVLSRLLFGTRISLSVGFIAVVIALTIGVMLGAVAGFFRGRVDDFIIWLINVVWSVPTLLLVIAISVALGRGFWQVFVALGLTMWVDVARLVRGQILSIREKEFVEAARALGFRTPRIIVRHILPNILGPMIVIASDIFANAILIEAGLSFLGLGAQPPTPSWGGMLKDGYGQILVGVGWWLAIFPGLCIMLMVLAFNLLGLGLRDAFDPKMRIES